jgi:uncharacterized protein
MSGELNLQRLLQSMKPDLQDAEYVFCSVSNDKADEQEITAICKFRELEGVTYIVTKEEAIHKGLDYIYSCRMITLNIHSSLEAVGFLAAITAKLADASISVNPVSAYYHDHLFVPSEKVEKVMELLKEFKK